MPSLICNLVTVLTILLPAVRANSLKSTFDLKRGSSSAIQVLGQLGFNGNFTDVLTTLEERMGAQFTDKLHLENLDNLLSLPDDESMKEIFAFDGKGLDLSGVKFTKTDSNLELIDGAKVQTNASVQWSPDNTGGGGTLLSVIQNAVVSGSKNRKKCLNSSECDEGQFCRRSYLGLPQQCHDCLGDGETCSENGQCCGDNTLCVWGQCKDGSEKGEAGTSCKATADCAEGHCCALVAGYPICKPFSTEGAECTVLDSDPSFLDQLIGVGRMLPLSCPCVQGMHCRPVNGVATILDDITGEKICVPSAGNSDDQAADNMVDFLHNVFNDVKKAGSKAVDVVKKIN